MQRILIVGYSRDDVLFHVHLASLCHELQSFSIGFEFRDSEFDINEQLESVQNRLRQVENLSTQFFELTFEQLITSDVQLLEDNTDSKSMKAYLALARVAKKFLFQESMMKALIDANAADFYGINKQSLTLIVEHLNQIDDTDIAMIVESHQMLAIRDALKSTRAVVETVFLMAPGFEAHDMFKSTLQKMQIPMFVVSTQHDNQYSMPKIIKNLLNNIKHKVRLSTSAKAVRKKSRTNNSESTTDDE